ncbi:MAG: GLUG motif-containing protein [Phycisphaerales bacterium]
MSAKRNTFQVRAVSLLLLSSIPSVRAYAFAGGTGEPNAPYQIATAEQLISIGSDPNLLDKHFVLLNDIDLDPNLPGGRVFTQAVIASDTDEVAPLYQGTPFIGCFDGNGKVIANLTIKSTLSNHLGLFGRLAAEASARDLNLTSATITGSKNVQVMGALAGSHFGSIINCRANATVAGKECVGGLVGYNAGVIVDCHVSGDIHVWGNEVVSDGGGGLVGSNAGILAQSSAHAKVAGVGVIGGLVGSNKGVIWKCCARGEVTGNDFLGGLVGRAVSGTIENCYSTANVSSEFFFPHVGGLVGFYTRGTITNCYAAGAIHNGVNEPEEVDWGGLVGWSIAGGPAITYCFWDTTASGVQQSAAGSGLSTHEMQTAATFDAAGWSFESAWMICERRDYPRLQWEGIRCEE